MKLVSVTLAINLGTHAAQGVQRKAMLFTNFPTHEDVESAIKQEDTDGRFEEFYNGLEVSDITEYISEFEEEGSLVMDVYDSEHTLIGHVLFDQVVVHDSSAVQIG